MTSLSMIPLPFPCLQIFLVRKSAKVQRKVLCLRLPSELGAPLREFAIKESAYSKCAAARMLHGGVGKWGPLR